MNKDNLSTAFELISDEIEAVADEIAEQGSKAFKDKRYPDAQRLAETGERLKAFKGKVDQLLDEWGNGFDQVTRTKTKIPKIPVAPRKPGTKSKKTRLRVKLKDGTELEEHIAADTFVETLQRIGFTEVEPLGISVRGVPLIGSSRSSQYQQRRVEGKYVITHSSTSEKADTLKDISKRLGLGMTVSIVR
jgi:hypothetical protein